jgi:ATP-dependent DNA helicase HFM1/MER3
MFNICSELDIQQMIGRAGRPQFDDSAVAVILTNSDKKQKYLKMVTGGRDLESRLHENLIEHLNAEIVLQSINNSDEAISWYFIFANMLGSTRSKSI